MIRDTVRGLEVSSYRWYGDEAREYVTEVFDRKNNRITATVARTDEWMSLEDFHAYNLKQITEG